MRAALLLILLLFGALQPSAPPQQARALWAGPGRALVQWEQLTPTSQACIDRHPAHGGAIQIVCIMAPVGWQSIPVPAGYPADGAYIPQPGDYYTITLWQGLTYLGTLGPYPLRSILWMPLRGPPPA